MKPHEFQDIAKAYTGAHFRIGSSFARLDVVLTPFEGTLIASIRRCEPPYEKVVPDFSSQSLKDAIFRADDLLHEGDHDRAQKIRQCRGGLIFMLRELAKEKRG